MIDHTYRCIFIHQRKVAGTAISQAFSYNWKNDAPCYQPFNGGVTDPQWNERPRDYYVFSAVRNPFDRLVSGWKMIATGREVSLEQIVENWPRDDWHEYIHITRPQVTILRDNKGILVTDDLIRYETLQTDFDRICDRIGKPRSEIPIVNAMERNRDYRVYFTPHTRRLTEEHFAEDFAAFGYEF